MLLPEDWTFCTSGHWTRQAAAFCVPRTHVVECLRQHLQQEDGWNDYHGVCCATPDVLHKKLAMTPRYRILTRGSILVGMALCYMKKAGYPSYLSGMPCRLYIYMLSFDGLLQANP